MPVIPPLAVPVYHQDSPTTILILHHHLPQLLPPTRLFHISLGLFRLFRRQILLYLCLDILSLHLWRLINVCVVFYTLDHLTTTRLASLGLLVLLLDQLLLLLQHFETLPVRGCAFRVVHLKLDLMEQLFGDTTQHRLECVDLGVNLR